MSEFEEQLHELKQRSEEKVQEFFRKLTSMIPGFIGLLIALWWIFFGALKITQAEVSLVDNLGVTLCSVVLSITMCELIAGGGFNSAKMTKRYITAELEYKNETQRGLHKQKPITKYAYSIAQANLADLRKKNLATNGLYYGDYFDKEGHYIGGDYKHNKKLKRYQKKAITKCIKLKVILPSIFGYISSKTFGLTKEISETEFRTKTVSKNTIIRIVISVLTANVMFEFIGFNAGSLIFAFFQIVLWTSSGLIQRISNFNFVLDKLVPQIQDKTAIIRTYLALPESEKQKYEIEETPVQKEKEQPKTQNESEEIENE
jgi:hypothetical protein